MSTVKIMLNDAEEIRKLAEDPDVQVKIKEAIIDAIGKRAVKTLNNELGGHVDDVVRSFVYPRGCYRLSEKVRKDIEKWVKDAVTTLIDEKTSDILEKEFYSLLRAALSARLAEIKDCDIAKILQNAASKLLERKLTK